ncbi:MAG: hypothetical protein ACYC1D_19640, partial [Acidimicrobiales bacterium]
HPWPSEQLVTAVAGYERADAVIWLQEEPSNMGAWGFVRDRLSRAFDSDYRLGSVTRAASGSPATGSHAMHELEQADLIERALG